MRVLAARVAAAADLATLAAVDDQDDVAFAGSGVLRLAPDAAAVARQYFAANLAPVSSFLEATPDDIAARADVAVFATAPASDPLTGASYDRPAVRLAAAVPLRAPLFGSLLLSPTTVVNVRAASSPR